MIAVVIWMNRGDGEEAGLFFMLQPHEMPCICYTEPCNLKFMEMLYAKKTPQKLHFE